MRAYLAGGEAELHRNLLVDARAKNVLYSFYYSKDKSGKTFSDFQDKFNNIFIDSGGYSARIQGVDIDVKDYGKYLKKVIARKKDTTDLVYANLDLLDTQETLRNQAYLESEGLEPLPVYHMFEFFNGDKQTFFDYIKKHKYIAVGGMAGSFSGKKRLERFLDFIFKYTKNDIKVHGFGINSFSLLERYPFYSVDSTTWLSGGRFRSLQKFEGGKPATYRKESKDTVEGLECHTDHYSDLNRKNAKTVVKVEKHITKLWKERGIVWK